MLTNDVVVRVHKVDECQALIVFLVWFKLDDCFTVS